MFHLMLDGSFEEFLEDDVKWKSTLEANRGLKADDPLVVKVNAKSAKQKATILKMMLNTIASYAQVIAREFIVNEALCLEDIWTRLRIHFGFRKSGALILDVTSLCQEEGESYEALWERLYALVTDNLLQPSDGLMHKGKKSIRKEEMTPTLMNLTVTLWLRIINPALPAMIKQKYTTELRNKTVASLREEISESLESLLAELNGEGACIARAFSRGPMKKGYSGSTRQGFNRQRSSRLCPLCDACGRASDHYLSECQFLPASDKRYLSSKARSRAVDVWEDSDEEEAEDRDRQGGAVKQVNISLPGESDKESRDHFCSCKCRCNGQEGINRKDLKPDIRRVDVVSSPYLWVKYGKHDVPLTLDT